MWASESTSSSGCFCGCSWPLRSRLSSAGWLVGRMSCGVGNSRFIPPVAGPRVDADPAPRCGQPAPTDDTTVCTLRSGDLNRTAGVLTGAARLPATSLPGLLASFYTPPSGAPGPRGAGLRCSPAPLHVAGHHAPPPLVPLVVSRRVRPSPHPAAAFPGVTQLQGDRRTVQPGGRAPPGRNT